MSCSMHTISANKRGFLSADVLKTNTAVKHLEQVLNFQTVGIR